MMLPTSDWNNPYIALCPLAVQISAGRFRCKTLLSRVRFSSYYLSCQYYSLVGYSLGFYPSGWHKTLVDNDRCMVI